MSKINSPDHRPPAEPAPPDADPVLSEYPNETRGRPTEFEPDENDVDDIGELYGVRETEGAPLKLGADLITPRDRDRWEDNPDSKDDPE